MHALDGHTTAWRGRRAASLLLGAWIAGVLPAHAHAQSLRGSTASVDRQYRVAHQHDYTFIDTAERVHYFADQGWLVEVEPTSDFVLRGVSFAYARPELELFVRRLAAQYAAACGERLVVTSLTRPTTRQPRNASDRSVHPTGMAVDLRYSRNRSCRAWLERVLTQLEGAGILDATRERFPVHYHIALFPRQYAAYVEALDGRQATAAEERLAYTVRAGDSLWGIARSHGTTVDDLRVVNGLASSRIYVGQVLDVPVAERAAVQ